MTAQTLWPRPSSAYLRRALQAAVVLSVGVALTLLLQPSLILGSSPFITGPSGHAFHPKLCGSSSGFNTSSSGCQELLNPALVQELVVLPPELQLRSGHPSLPRLRQQLVAAVAQGWPLALARRFSQLLLEHITPDGEFPQPPPLPARHSGHPRGWDFITAALSLLAAAGRGQFVGCAADASLPTAPTGRFLFSAALLGEADASSLPNALLQLLHTVAALPPGHAYVSVAASLPPAAAAGGSRQVDSVFWLDLLQLLLVPLGVPLQLLVMPAPPLVPLTASSSASAPKLVVIGANGQHITRNAALAPFFPAPGSSSSNNGTRAGSASTAAAAAAASGRHLSAAVLEQATTGSSTNSSSSSSSKGGSSRITFGSCAAGQPRPGCYRPQSVVFFDGVTVFCARDMVRLMHYPADLACGIRLAEPGARPPKHRHSRRAAARRRLQVQQQQQQAQEQGRQEQLQEQQQQQQGEQRQPWRLHAAPPSTAQPAAAASFAAASAAQLQRQRQGRQQRRQLAQAAVLGEGPVAAAAAAAALVSDVPPEFVLRALHAGLDATRDLAGRPLGLHPPYFSHAASAEQAVEGLPVPVACCWGGLAKMAAAPLAAGLRFRAAVGDECAASEVNLLCNDMRRTGHGHMLLDPGVRTSRQLRTKRLFEAPRFPFFFYGKFETTEWFDIEPLLPLAALWEQQERGNGSASGSRNATWQASSFETCCELSTPLGGGRPGAAALRPGPADCRRVDILGGVNHTSAWWQQCGGTQRMPAKPPC